MTASHWDRVYSRRAVEELGWFVTVPERSLRLVTEAAGPEGAVVDIGGGASTLVGELLARGYRDLTVVDISGVALGLARERLGEGAGAVSWVARGVLDWAPGRVFDVWHDRAVFHFLVDPADRDRYVERATSALRPGGSLVLACFAADGPTQCSGLPTARYDAEELASVFAPLELAAAEREEHETPAGIVQPFTWVVLKRH